MAKELIRLTLIALVTLFSLNCSMVLAWVPQQGDIIFQDSPSSQSLAVKQATESRYSHVGIILFKKGQPYVFEASSKVIFTPLKEWITYGENGHYVAKRLKEGLSEQQVAVLNNEVKRYEGKPYDLKFEWSDSKMYCSELVWKMYKKATGLEIGHLQEMREFNLTSPLVREKMQERYGNNAPLSQKIVSPASMFDSPLLVTVGGE